MKHRPLVLAVLSALIVTSQPPAHAAPGSDARLIERGKYLSRVSGCNDCHTPGYAQSAGRVADNLVLTGTPVGFQGPWGTSYAANLRLYMNQIGEAEWLARARQPMRPPMPWFNLRDMSDRDLLALYRYVRSLGPAGEPAPVAAGPGEPVATPFIEFAPRNPPAQARQASR